MSQEKCIVRERKAVKVFLPSSSESLPRAMVSSAMSLRTGEERFDLVTVSELLLRQSVEVIGELAEALHAQGLPGVPVAPMALYLEVSFGGDMSRSDTQL